MRDEHEAIALNKLSDLCGLSPGDARRWAREDGWALEQTDDGPGAPCRRLRESLEARGLPIPRAIETWPRVLVADDDRDVLQIIVWLIQQAYPQADIRAVADGAGALKAMRSFKPHLLITDLKMPGAGGLALCRRVRKDHDLSGTRILAISGHDSRESRQALFAGGAAEFVAKPFEPREIKESLARLLGEAPEEPLSLRRG